MSVVQSSGGAQLVGVFGGRVGEWGRGGGGGGGGGGVGGGGGGVGGGGGKEAGCCSHAHVPQRSCVGIII